MTLSKARLKELRLLTHKKYREEQKKFLVEGLRFVQEAADSGHRIIEAFYTKEILETPAGKGLLGKLREKTTDLHLIGTREMEIISETVSFQGIVAVVRRREYSLDALFHDIPARSHLVALDGISDPGNAGTMVRTSDWFGMDGVILGNNCVDICNPKALRATMGAVFHLPVVEHVDLLSALSRAKGLGYSVYITDPRGETHFDRINYEGRSIIVFGNEAWGVSDQVKQLADYRVSIRRYGQAESLNVSVSCGIVLAAMHRLYE
jgi:TrmH family RNA methyltransferase